MSNRTGKMKEVECLWCGIAVECDKDTRTVLCSACCSKLADAPVLPKYLKKEIVDGEEVVVKRVTQTGFPRGWHLKKEYVHTDGSVWAKGKLVTPASDDTPTVENPDVPSDVVLEPVEVTAE